MKDNLHKQIEDILKNLALSQINTSLIADEVLKVVGEKIREVKYSSHNPTIDCVCKTCVICNKLLNNLK